MNNENTEAVEVENQEAISGNSAQQSVEPEESVVQINWKRANEVMSLQKQRIQELEQKMAALSQSDTNSAKNEEEEEEDDADPEDYVTVAKARELARKQAEKAAKKAAQTIVQEYAHQQTLSSDESRMRSKFEDYDFVIENFTLPLLKEDPALAHKVRTSKNPAETAYKLGRLSDQYSEVHSEKIHPKAEKILKNSSRPSSAFAAGSSLKTQVDQASSLSPAQIWEMSQKYARGG